MPELELGPVWLSLRLATVTVVVLLAIATPLAWWLAFTRARARAAVEAVVAMPLVLPPTVLGFYLLILLGPAGFLGRPWMELTDTVRAQVAEGLNMAAHARRRAARRLLECGVAARIARIHYRGRAHVRPHARRVRRGAHGGRQHPRQHQSHFDRYLRARRDSRLRASARAVGCAACVLLHRVALGVRTQSAHAAGSRLTHA